MSLTENSQNPYDRDSFLCLKGYLVICVILHHLYQFTGFLSGTTIGYPFYLLGHWAVVVFIFISGFGIYSSYIKKGDAYIKAFPRKRLLPFFVTYLIFVAIYTVAALIRHTEITPSLIITSLTFGGSIVGYGWYFQLTLVMYLLFFVLRRFIKKDTLFFVLISVFIAVFIGWFFSQYTAETIYEPASSFLTGILFAHLYNKKPDLFTKRAWINALCGIVVFTGATLLYTLMEFRYAELMQANRFADLAHLLLMIVADLGLVVFVLAVISIFNKYATVLVHNPVARFLGTYSLEIYAFQSLVFGILVVIIDKTGNLVLFAVASVICTIAISIPAHKLLTKLK